MSSNVMIQTMVEKARSAQRVYESFNQQQVDAIVRAIAKVVYDRAEELARMAIAETRMGVLEDKIQKNLGKSRIIWHSLKGKKSVGLISCDARTGVAEVAKPMGVIGLVTPCTNPIVTPMCNAMFALKGRNAIIIAPHPRARNCAGYLTGLFSEAIRPLGAPENLIQVIAEPTNELTADLMQAVDVIVATGGMGMVKAAYSSGKPAFGVGAGNVQCIIDRDADFAEAVSKIITGRIFDNGIICSGEQSVIVHADDYDAVIREMAANGAFLVRDPVLKDQLRRALFVNGVMNKDLVGQSVGQVAAAAGIELPAGTKVVLVEADGVGREDVLCREKMCPVITSFKYRSFAEAVAIAKANLEAEGQGHSISIHSNNQENINLAAEQAPVCRVLINQICSTMNGGSFFNGFAPTTTLGCGSWGNNSISENLDYKHLINITRIGYYLKDAVVPTDAEIWG